MTKQTDTGESKLTDLEHTTKVVAGTVEYIQGEADLVTARIVTGRLHGSYADALKDVERQEQVLLEKRAIADAFKNGLDALNRESA